MDDDNDNEGADDSQSINEKEPVEDDCYARSQSSSESQSTRPSPSPTGSSSGFKRPSSNTKQDEVVSSNKKVLQLVADRLKKSDGIVLGKHDSFGKHVADELNNMPLENPLLNTL
ncbi:uncharacterized protein LOC126748466 [Anthonomus grandis grandis]|uniref:uncharacterized protein LOC126748466 n=1 Tax=Anthonomus grandis grandis TaxID=2921223 RepID=UPI0021661A9F|nr:uncharacterized protein LOC126748466 [Anthonomus grandis grandis]